MATNDELIRMVATTIKQYVFSATMEEALDAAKAVLAITERRYQLQQEFYELRGLLTSGMTDFATTSEITAEVIIGGLMRLQVLRQSIETGEDYTIISTEPLIVTEEIEPEGINAPTNETTQETQGTEAPQ